MDRTRLVEEMTYQQLTGLLYGADNTVWGVGYSGKEDSKNNPADEGLMDRGPIPTGNYKIVGPPYDSSKHGKFVLHLVPDDLTRQAIIDLGRDPDSFLLHGDNIEFPGTASEGCIIMDRAVRERVWRNNAKDDDLTVVAA